MKEAIGRCLAHRRGKTKTHLSCRTAEQTTGHKALPQSALESPFHPWLQKAFQHPGRPAEKSNTRRCALLSLRLLLILMSLCMSSLLTLAMQAMTNAPALAVA